jgi:hypothetical protein
MQKNAFPFYGSAFHESDKPGYQVSYRFHITDPVRFSKSIKVTMEHGHANQLSDDWSSTAYWYQSLPAEPITIQPVGERLPLIAKVDFAHPMYIGDRTPQMEKAIKDTSERMTIYFAKRQEVLRQKEAKTRKDSSSNIADAKKRK